MEYGFVVLAVVAAVIGGLLLIPADIKADRSVKKAVSSRANLKKRGAKEVPMADMRVSGVPLMGLPLGDNEMGSITSDNRIM